MASMPPDGQTNLMLFLTVPGNLVLSGKLVNNMLDDRSSIRETKDDQETKNR
jgi:hypothetical protein